MAMAQVMSWSMPCYSRSRAGCPNNVHIRKGMKQDLGLILWCGNNLGMMMLNYLMAASHDKIWEACQILYWSMGWCGQVIVALIPCCQADFSPRILCIFKHEGCMRLRLRVVFFCVWMMGQVQILWGWKTTKMTSSLGGKLSYEFFYKFKVLRTSFNRETDY